MIEMSNSLPLISAANAIAALLAGSYVYVVGKRRVQNAVWLVYNILFSLWSFCIYSALVSGDPLLTMYWFRASLAAVIFLVPVFLHFLATCSDRKVFKNQILSTIYIIFFLFFIASFIVPKEFIKGIASGTYFKYTINPGLAFNIFTFIFAGFLITGFYYLLRSSKLYLRFKRNQRLWLFLGMLLGIFAPLGFLLSVYRINVFPFGLFCVIPYLALTGYTIVKYHVLEVDIVVNKTVIFSYFTVFVILVYMGLVHLLHRVVGIEYFAASVITGVIVLLNLLLIAHFSGTLRLGKISDRIVYEKKLDYYKFLENFASISNRETDLASLSNYVLESLVDTVGIENAALYIYDEDSANFVLIAEKGLDKKKMQEVKNLSAESPLVKFLREGNVYVVNEKEDFAEDYDMQEINSVLEKINARLSIPLCFSFPLYHERDIAAFLNVGNKKDASPYSREDIDILNAFGRQLGVCIDNAKLYTHAIEDDLTKLYRVNYFNKRIQEEIERSKRYQRPFSLLIIDVDDFKKINDTFGHPVGDEVLKKIAYLIKSNIRAADIAGRCGGEEFDVLMPETDKANALVAAERIRRTIEEEFSRPGRDPVEPHLEKIHTGKKDKIRVSTTVSIGVADYREGMKSHELIKAADEALYKAKREGKNRVCA